MRSQTATLCGLMAILLWGSLIGLLRSVAESFGPLAGAAAIYSVGCLLLLFFVGLPRLRGHSLGYLSAAALLFTSYEMCLALSIGLANNASQAIEVSMLNYLWPCLTIVLAIPINRQRATFLIVPGSLLALFGIAWILSGDGLSLSGIRNNINDNPLSYSLALAGALIWALYCNITRRFASGQNGITLFFALTALVLWLMYLFNDETVTLTAIGWFSTFELIAAAMVMAVGYALWNIGILRGNMTLLATASYFTPVLSAAFAAFWLGNALSWQFWQGTMLVTGGSLLCWWSTRKR